MAIIVPTNFARATVSSPPSGTSGLIFTVAAGKGALFPSPGAGEYFYGVFTNAARTAYEVVKIESRSTDSFTIATSGRGQDSSTAATWNTGDIFFLPSTRKMYQETSFAAPSLAIAGVTAAADKVPYFTSATAASTTDLTSFARTLLDDTTAAAARTTLGLGTMAVETATNYPTKSEITGRNVLINGAFNVAQRGTSFTSASTPANSDDTYLLDRWTLLSDGNDIVDVAQNTTTVPTGSLYSCAMDVETANKKFGIIQFVEQKDAQRLIGGTATLSFKARKGAANATVNTMRAVVLAWDGTADAVTSDVVSAWGASGANPTLVANWTAENVAADLTLTDSFQTFSITGISIDTASAKNLAVFLYYNDTDGTVGDFIYVTDVQLESGSVATVFDQRHFGEELMLCQRYFWASGSFSLTYPTALSGSTSSAVRAYIPNMVDMRTAPTVTVLTQTQVDRANSNLAAGNATTQGFNLIADVAAGSGVASWTGITLTAAAEL